MRTIVSIRHGMNREDYNEAIYRHGHADLANSVTTHWRQVFKSKRARGTIHAERRNPVA